jgi:hypothetical protein
MPISELVNAGAVAGLLAAVFNGLLSLVIAPLRRFQPAELAVREQGAGSTSLLTWLLYLVTGAALGSLFWISWGLVAIFGIPWWQRGLVFAFAIWAATCLPLALNLLVQRRWHWSVAVTSIVEWLVMLVFVGLACAWRWSSRSV